MPTTEPMTGGEIARLFGTLNVKLDNTDTKLDGIRSELNNKPSNSAFTEFKMDQLRTHAEQENRIRDVDSRQTKKNDEQDVKINAVDAKADKLLFAIIATALGAAANLITNISGG